MSSETGTPLGPPIASLGAENVELACVWRLLRELRKQAKTMPGKGRFGQAMAEARSMTNIEGECAFEKKKALRHVKSTTATVRASHALLSSQSLRLGLGPHPCLSSISFCGHTQVCIHIYMYIYIYTYRELCLYTHIERSLSLGQALVRARSLSLSANWFRIEVGRGIFASGILRANFLRIQASLSKPPKFSCQFLVPHWQTPPVQT